MITHLSDFSEGVRVLDEEKERSPFKIATPFAALSGAQGIVDKVQRVDDSSGQLYARKRTPIKNKTSAHIEKEFKIIAQAHHPHIIKFEYVYIFEGYLNMIVSPWCEFSLQDVRMKIFKEKFNHNISQSLQFIVSIIGCLTNAIHYLHNIVKVKHLDIKPNNIVLDGTSLLPFIIDFGISDRFSKNSGDFSAYAGTPRYSSPEQEARELCHRSSDMYSLGGVFVFLLMSFHSKYKFGPMMRRCKKGFFDPLVKVALEEVLKGVPCAQDLIGLVLPLVSKDKNTRPSADVFFNQLQQFAATYNFPLHCTALTPVPVIPQESEVESVSEEDEEDAESEGDYNFLDSALTGVTFADDEE